jgi:hypothetical protein
MRYLIIAKAAPQVVANVVVADSGFVPDPAFTAVAYDAPASPGWSWDGTTASPNNFGLTVQDYERAVQQVLDKQARAWGYSTGMDRAISYLGDPNVQWNADAMVLRVWRSAVWVKCDDIMAHVDPEHPPTIPEVLAQLPTAPERPKV